MSLSDLASLGSFVSGVAVLVSLVYLALQVRQAEKNQRALMQQGRAARMMDLQLRIATPEMGELFAKGSQGGDLSAVEFLRYRAASRAGIISFEDTFYQHREGLLADAPFETSRDAFAAGLALPGRRALWRLERDLYESGFRTYVDGLASQKATAMAELAEWRAALTTSPADA
jgi:hypothetical protein